MDIYVAVKLYEQFNPPILLSSNRPPSSACITDIGMVAYLMISTVVSGKRYMRIFWAITNWISHNNNQYSNVWRTTITILPIYLLHQQIIYAECNGFNCQNRSKIDLNKKWKIELKNGTEHKASFWTGSGQYIVAVCCYYSARLSHCTATHIRTHALHSPNTAATNISTNMLGPLELFHFFSSFFALLLDICLCSFGHKFRLESAHCSVINTKVFSILCRTYKGCIYTWTHSLMHMHAHYYVLYLDAAMDTRARTHYTLLLHTHARTCYSPCNEYLRFSADYFASFRLFCVRVCASNNCICILFLFVTIVRHYWVHWLFARAIIRSSMPQKNTYLWKKKTHTLKINWLFAG